MTFNGIDSEKAVPIYCEALKKRKKNYECLIYSVSNNTSEDNEDAK